MVTKAFLKTDTNIHEYYIHDIHECDMNELMENHPEKQIIINKDNTQWHTIQPDQTTKSQIEKTCWYKNKIWDHPELKKILKETKEIEYIHIR